MIKAVIFDLGNVMVSFNHHFAAEKIARLSAKTEKEIFQFFFDSPLTGLFEEGKISPREFFREVKKALKLDIDYADFLPVWNEIFFLTDSNRAVYKLAKGLRKNYRVALLSNINTLHFDYLKDNFPVFDAFHNLLFSFEMKLKKPDARIYKKALAVLAARPEETFYTDDRQELIESSRKLGIQGFVFKGVKQLKKDLKDAGVKING
jgi:HAD superfamily hydrolase (TIGR01509 family)